MTIIQAKQGIYFYVIFTVSVAAFKTQINEPFTEIKLEYIQKLKTMFKNGFIQNLAQLLSGDLPGYSAQKLMEPPLRNTIPISENPVRKAATLLPLYYEDGWKFLLIQRSSHPLDKHKGQISFPGGSIETQESASEAALREAEEEVSIPREQVQLIGKLTDLFIPVSNFTVSPHVGLVDITGVTLKAQVSEVERIIHVDLDEFMEESSIGYQDMQMENGMKVKNVPYFLLNKEIVWGATAMMLSEFRTVCLEIIK